MTAHRVIIALALLLCLFSLNPNGVFALELPKITETVTGGGPITITIPELLSPVAPGFWITVNFNDLSITEELSIEGTGFSESVTTNKGTIKGGPYQVTLLPGTYTICEKYIVVAASTSTLLGNPVVEFEEVILKRTFTIPSEINGVPIVSATYTVVVCTTIGNLRVNIVGPFEILKEGGDPTNVTEPDDYYSADDAPADGVTADGVTILSGTMGEFVSATIKSIAELAGDVSVSPSFSADLCSETQLSFVSSEPAEPVEPPADTTPPEFIVQIDGQELSDGQHIKGNNPTPTITADISDADSGVADGSVSLDVAGDATTVTYGAGVFGVPLLELGPDGAYRITVFADDNAGNGGLFFFDYWLRTSIPDPTVEIPQEITNVPQIDVTVSNVLTGSTATWLVNGNPAATHTFGDEDVAGVLREVTLSEGLNTITVEVVDECGNEASTNVEVVLDTVAPNIVLLQPDDGSTIPGDGITVIIEFGDDTGVDADTIEVSTNTAQSGGSTNRLASSAALQEPGPTVNLDGIPVASSDIIYDASTGQLSFPILAPSEGTYQVLASVEDLAGNVSSLFSASFEVDTTPPAMQFLGINTGDAIDTGLPQLSASITPADDVQGDLFSVMLTRTANLEGQPVNEMYNVGFLYESSSGQLFIILVTEPGADGEIAVPENDGLPDGSYTLKATAVDLVGNTTTIMVSFMIDTANGTTGETTVVFAYPAPGETVNIETAVDFVILLANLIGIQPPVILTINGVSFELDGQDLGQLDRGRLAISLNRLAAQQFGGINPGFHLDPLELSALEKAAGGGGIPGTGASLFVEGENHITVEVTDTNGNVTISETTFIGDYTSTSVPTLNNLPSVTINPEISVSGEVDGDAFGIEVEIFVNDGVPIATVNADPVDGTFTAQNVRLFKGENTISARAKDIAGNLSDFSPSQTIFLDLQAPDVIIDNLPAVVNNADIDVTGTVTDNDRVESLSIVVNSGEPQDVSTSGGNDFSAGVTLTPGENTIFVEAVDAVGNVGTETITVLLDAEAPTTAPTDLTARVSPTGSGIQLSWLADEDAATYSIYRSEVEITNIGDLQPIAAGITTTQFTDFEIDAGKTLYYGAVSVDAAGNESVVLSNSPNVALIHSTGGVAAIPDGTRVEFGQDALFDNPARSASVSINVVSDDSIADLPSAIPGSAHFIEIIGQSGTPVEMLNKTATLTLAYPEGLGDTLRVFELNGSTWKELEDQAIDTASNIVSAQIESHGIYRVGESQPQQPWDVNGDNTVNIFDLVIVAGEFGKSPPDNLRADVVMDGTVNIFDLVGVASHFGETYGPTAAPAARNRTSSGAEVEIRMIAEAVPIDSSVSVAETTGDMVTVQVRADSSVQLAGGQFKLGFDVRRLSVVEATKGNIFDGQGNQSYWLPPKSEDGELTLASVAIDRPTPKAIPRGSVLAQITFRVSGDLATALKSIRLENVLIADLDGKFLLADWQNQVNMTSIAKPQVRNSLLQNYPNPFNPETWIPYSTAKDARVVIKLYDVFGNAVRTIDLGFVPAGEYMAKEHAVYWDGRNEHGEHVASGVYFYTLEAGEFVSTKKLVVLK